MRGETLVDPVSHSYVATSSKQGSYFSPECPSWLVAFLIKADEMRTEGETERGWVQSVSSRPLLARILKEGLESNPSKVEPLSHSKGFSTIRPCLAITTCRPVVRLPSALSLSFPLYIDCLNPPLLCALKSTFHRINESNNNILQHCRCHSVLWGSSLLFGSCCTNK